MFRSFPALAVNLHRPLLSQFPTITPASTRLASLSSIHRGLRRSERVQYGEVRPRSSEQSRGQSRGHPRDQSRDQSRDQTRGKPRGRGRKDDDIEALTAKALAGTGSKRAQYRLLKKLNKKQQEEDGTGPKTRRKRFMDPDLDFGKKSLVYQLKQGSLKDLVNKIDEPVRPRTFRDNPRPARAPLRISGRAPARDPAARLSTAEFAERFSPTKSVDRVRSPPAGARRDTGEKSWSARDRTPHSFDRRSTTDRADRFTSNNQSDRRSSHTTRPSREAAQTTDRRRTWNDRSETNDDSASGDARISTPAPRERRGKMMPITIQYTTAASQFLYGKAVVRAALEQGRRKLYHLYIYGGENRQESKDHTIISRLAVKHNIPVTIIPNEDQRLMDKMSQGRPHNGFVLETSPLPQKPVVSLGSLVETPSQLGFHIDLDHQTREQEEVNGKDTFVPRSSSVTAKPFVLLLNEILDPGNLGGLLRTASYLGVDAVGITSRSSSNLTPIVLKAAAGAVEEITVFSVTSPVKFLEDSKKAGWKSFAAIPPPDRKLVRKHGDKFMSTELIEQQSPLGHDPCILVLGNEGHGLSKEIKLAADYELSFPRFVQDSCVDSLNVSVAAGLLCHAFVRKPAETQKFVKGKSTQKASLEGNETTVNSTEKIF